MRLNLVAPHAGALVETVISVPRLRMIDVAPHAGALVETQEALTMNNEIIVAPHAGALVETMLRDGKIPGAKSRLTQAR